MRAEGSGEVVKSIVTSAEQGTQTWVHEALMGRERPDSGTGRQPAGGASARGSRCFWASGWRSAYPIVWSLMSRRVQDACVAYAVSM